MQCRDEVWKRRWDSDAPGNHPAASLGMRSHKSNDSALKVPQIRHSCYCIKRIRDDTAYLFYHKHKIGKICWNMTLPATISAWEG